MVVIGDELERIALLYGADYMRTQALTEANVELHYKQITGLLVIYDGNGIITATYEGAEPLSAVATTVYVLAKSPTTDELASDIDAVLEQTRQLAANIIYNFNITERDIIDYTLDPVGMLDDIMIGHLLTFSPIISGDVCTNPTP